MTPGDYVRAHRERLIDAQICGGSLRLAALILMEAVNPHRSYGTVALLAGVSESFVRGAMLLWASELDRLPARPRA